jgi:uncharacterized membrane protein YkoI
VYFIQVRSLIDPVRIAERIKTMSILRVVALGAVLTLLLSATIVGQEKKINRSELPPAVEKTVAAQTKGATIRGFSKETENGQVRYEAELMVNGHSRDIEMDASGAIVEVEEEVTMDSLPTAVKDGLQAKAGKGKLIKVESITKHEQLVAYEAKVVTGGKKSEIQVDPNGKPLDHEE